MNRILTILSLGFLLAVISLSCNKTNSSDPQVFDCINNTFVDSSDLKIKPTYIEEDNKGNITILGNYNETITIARFDANGVLLWHREYPQLQGREQGLAYVDENAFLIKTSTRHYEYELSEKSYENVWIKNGMWRHNSKEYVDTYELGDMQPKLQLPNTNTSYLTKIGADGNIIWTKEFKGDFCTGNSFFRVNRNDFLFLTSEFYGPYWELVDHEGIVDTITYPNDRNKRTVYRIDGEGNTVWSTEIKDVFELTRLYEGSDSYYNLRHAISQNGDRILVNTFNETFELSLSGELIKSFQPMYDYPTNHTWHMLKADEQSIYFLGIVDTSEIFNEDRVYTIKYDIATGNISWENRTYYMPFNVSSYPGKSLISYTLTGHDYFYLKKTNINGQEVWNKNIPKPGQDYNVSALKTSCNGGAILAITYYNYEKLVLIKTNSFGEY
jgi:hypothetical protein